MIDLHNPFRVKLYVLPDGFVRTALESKEGSPTPRDGFDFYSMIEPEILRFKKAVYKKVSAQSGRSRKEQIDKQL